jgi:hypothetical protein
MRDPSVIEPRRRENSIAVDWRDCAWSPPIVVLSPRAGAAKMSNGTRPSARFILRSNGTLPSPARFRIVRRSGVNALRVQTSSLPTAQNLMIADRPFSHAPQTDLY